MLPGNAVALCDEGLAGRVAVRDRLLPIHGRVKERRKGRRQRSGQCQIVLMAAAVIACPAHVGERIEVHDAMRLRSVRSGKKSMEGFGPDI